MGMEVGFRGVLPDQVLVLQDLRRPRGRTRRPPVGRCLCPRYRRLHLDCVTRPSPPRSQFGHYQKSKLFLFIFIAKVICSKYVL